VHGVIWSPTAVAQLRAIRAYLAQFNPKAAEELAADLIAAGHSAENFPHRGRPVPGTEMADIMTRRSLHPVLRSRIEASALQVF